MESDEVGASVGPEVCKAGREDWAAGCDDNLVGDEDGSMLSTDDLWGCDTGAEDCGNCLTSILVVSRLGGDADISGGSAIDEEFFGTCDPDEVFCS